MKTDIMCFRMKLFFAKVFVISIIMLPVATWASPRSAPAGRQNQLALGANHQARAATQPTAAPPPPPIATPVPPIGEIGIGSEFLQMYNIYRQSFEDARAICFASHQAVDGVLDRLSSLLGTSIGVIVGGGVGTAAGGVNIWLTGRTMTEERAYATFSRRVYCLEQERERVTEHLRARRAEGVSCDAAPDLSEEYVTDLIRECLGEYAN